MTYQLAVHGGYNPDYYHFTDACDLAEWMVSQGDSILEVTVREV